MLVKVLPPASEPPPVRSTAGPSAERAEMLSPLTMILGGDVGKLDFLHCYMLISCSLKLFWQRLLVQVGRRILKRLERTNLYNIYNHEKFIYVYVYIRYILYLYIYIYMSISRDTQTTCNNSLLQLHWQRNDLDQDFHGFSGNVSRD